MDYNFSEIEKKWQNYWRKNKTYKVEIDNSKPKYYILDMFPYPSGAGLHVGHPLGYIASDIYARYKRHKGFNVLHPMGYDAYGLPAEQYAIQTGTHPAVTTEKNIERYREQLDNIGFSYDWDREIRTCDPKYYKWTQWTFIQLFNSFFNKKSNKAEKIELLIAEFSKNGNKNVDVASADVDVFSAEQWNSMNEKSQQEMLMNYRLAYLADTMVNWCPELGTVLANDEVKEGLSERGGYPVERKLMRQWSLRITAYAQRLLDGLDKLAWSDSMKEIQRNWIGRSEGASVNFNIKNHNAHLEVFTTRPDTLYGATFMVIAPEHEMVKTITTDDNKDEVEKYVVWAKNRSERERMSEVKSVSGVFTGAYGINPISGEEIPIWIADYVLIGYGTGAIMAVPGHDSRDFSFARHFNLPIIQVVTKDGDEIISTDLWEDSYDSKEGKMINSGIIDGLEVKSAISKIVKHIEDKKLGYGTINYRLRDAIFSRQRYWGEPFPIFYKNGMPYALKESDLPLLLPEVDKYLPTPDGEPPLARAKNWVTKDGFPLETNTMPGFAGSSGYYLRYMDPKNENQYFSKEANNYWRDIDLYLGGDEHATGHLIYSRFWNLFLFDIGLVCEEEPFKRLLNQGKIQGRSSFVYRINGTNTYVSKDLKKEHKTTRLHVDISLVTNDYLDTEGLKKWRPEFKDAEFILSDGKYLCGYEVEKMSKSKYNVQNPDELIERYGADTFRLYEMFLGPIESHKPWDTQGIEGTFRFIRKLWRLFHNAENEFVVTDEKPTPEELKVLHKTLKSVEDDIERFSFNTPVSHFMILVNKLTELKCNKRDILSDLCIIIAPYIPHIAEELWSNLGNKTSVTSADFPKYNAAFVQEDKISYPVSFNGKVRFKIEVSANTSKDEVEKIALSHSNAAKWIGEKSVRKVIVVPKRIVNVVIG